MNITNPIDECLAKGAYHNERIRCPECKYIQIAEVIHTDPWFCYVHCCRNCNYLIMESEWDCIDKSKTMKTPFFKSMWTRETKLALAFTSILGILFSWQWSRDDGAINLQALLLPIITMSLIYGIGYLYWRNKKVD